MNHLFIFPEAVQTEDTIALDLEGNRLSFSCSNKLVAINLDALRSGSSTVIDKSGKDIFMKVFLPKGQPELRSRTHDFSRFPHVVMADLHKLDRAFSWTVHHVKAQIHYGRIEGSLVFERSAFWKEPVYVSHAGQTQELTQGENWFSFAWSPTEDVYCGPQCGRYKGRALHVSGGQR